MDRQLRGYLVKVLAATMALLCPFAVGVVIVDRVSVSILVIAWTLSVLAFRPNLATSVTPKLVRLFLMACLAITLFDLVSRPVLVKPLWVRATAMFEHPWPPMPLVHRCVANLRYRGREYGDLATVTGVKTDREEREVTFSTDAHGHQRHGWPRV